MSTLSGVSYGGKVYYQNLIPALAKVDKVNKYVIFIYDQDINNLFISQDNFEFILLNKLYRNQLLRFIQISF